MKQLFLTSSANAVLGDILKYLPLKPEEYNFAFINTASEVSGGDHWWVTADKNKMVELGFKIEEFSITGMNSQEIEERLKDKNGIFMCGGNPFYLLDQIIKTGFDKILLDRIEKGLVYIGSSAGSMILGDNLDLVATMEDKTKAPDLNSNGLKYIDLVIQPHWGDESLKEEYFNFFNNMYNTNTKLVLIRNNQYVYFNGDNYLINQVN